MDYLSLNRSSDNITHTSANALLNICRRFTVYSCFRLIEITTSIDFEHHERAVYKSFDRFITSLTCVVIIIGLVGNLISFKLIIIHRELHIPINVYFCVMCVSSLVSLIGKLIIIINAQIILPIYPIFYPVMLSNQMAGIFVLVSVQLARFHHVYSGRGMISSKVYQKQKNKRDNRIAVYVFSGIYIFSAVYCLPYWFIYRYDNVSKTLLITDLGKNNRFKWIIYFGMYYPVVYLIPCVILITTNLYLVKVLGNTMKRKCEYFKRASQEFEKGRMRYSAANEFPAEIEGISDEQEELLNVVIRNQINLARRHRSVSLKVKNKSIVLVALVFFFSVCQFPNLLMNLLQAIKWNTFQIEFYMFFNSISNFLIIVNVSFNFCFFGFFDKIFRNRFKQTFWL